MARQDIALVDWREWDFLETQTRLLADLIEEVRSADRDRVGIIFPLLDSVQESTSSLEILARRKALRDSYVVSRVIFETAVNACFVLTDPIVLSDRANKHSKQKALRNLVRSINVAGSPLFSFKHQAADEIVGQPEHKKWLEEYTSSSGREITAWTPENVQQKLDEIYKLFGAEATKGLAFGLLLYRHASEIAHGTLYGTMYSWGAMEIGRPIESEEDIGRFRRDELRHVIKLVCFSLESLIRVASTAVDAPKLAIAAEKARFDFYAKREQH